ncbi:MAG: hypothetical protein AB7F65_05155 [Dehalococcoidia bacterium]
MVVSIREVISLDVTGLADPDRLRLISEIKRMVSAYGGYVEDEASVLGWTSRTLAEALTRLERENGWVQADVIRQALANGGIVTRAQVYKIGGYPKSRQLRGFTRPVDRVVTAMQEEGLVPRDAADLIQTMYTSGPVADGFRVPSELAALLDE